MKLSELFEGAVKRAADAGTYRSTIPKPNGKFCISINGKKWGNFDTYNSALKVAEKMYAKKPKLHIEVVPC